MHKAYTKKGTYFQFPLCALSYGSSVKEQLEAILHYGCRLAGRREWERISDVERWKWIELRRQAPNRPCHVDFNRPDDCALLMGAQIIGVNYSSFQSVRRELAGFDDYLDRFEERHGRDPVVRLKMKYLFEARDGRGMNYRELAVLTAIFSIIGRRRKPVRISQAYLSCRCLGFRTKAIREADGVRRSASLPAITDWQLRSTLSALRRRKLIHRFTYGRRHTYYGVGMTAKDFEAQVIDRATRPFSTTRLTRIHDEELTHAIRCQRALLQDRRPPAPGETG